MGTSLVREVPVGAFGFQSRAQERLPTRFWGPRVPPHCLDEKGVATTTAQKRNRRIPKPMFQGVAATTPTLQSNSGSLVLPRWLNQPADRRSAVLVMELAALQWEP